MAEARTHFKERNPDYKSGYRPTRIVKETFPEVSYRARKQQGLSQKELFGIAQEKFQGVSLYGL